MRAFRALPATNNVPNLRAKFDLFYRPPGGTLSDLGLSISSTGVITFVPGQTFLVRGCSNKEVAATLGVSVRIAESHRAHIVKKMKFTNFIDMVRYSIRAGYIKP